VIDEAFDAFGEAAGPICEEMGISPEVVEACGDLAGAAVGSAMMMAQWHTWVE
jgi:hypothetical protein